MAYRRTERAAPGQSSDSVSQIPRPARQTRRRAASGRQCRHDRPHFGAKVEHRLGVAFCGRQPGGWLGADRHAVCGQGGGGWVHAHGVARVIFDDQQKHLQDVALRPRGRLHAGLAPGQPAHGADCERQTKVPDSGAVHVKLNELRASNRLLLLWALAQTVSWPSRNLPTAIGADLAAHRYLCVLPSPAGTVVRHRVFITFKWISI